LPCLKSTVAGNKHSGVRNQFLAAKVKENDSLLKESFYYSSAEPKSSLQVYDIALDSRAKIASKFFLTLNKGFAYLFSIDAFLT